LRDERGDDESERCVELREERGEDGSERCVELHEEREGGEREMRVFKHVRCPSYQKWLYENRYGVVDGELF